MLNFNMAVDSKTNWQENWKLLVYDDFCRDVISVLFKVAPKTSSAVISAQSQPAPRCVRRCVSRRGASAPSRPQMRVAQVADLRKLGVTLHLNLHADRQPVQACFPPRTVLVLYCDAESRCTSPGRHLHLKHAVQDVAAIYLVEATRANVERIARDCAAGLYDSIYLNWCPPRPRARAARRAVGSV